MPRARGVLRFWPILPIVCFAMVAGLVYHRHKARHESPVDAEAHYDQLMLVNAYPAARAIIQMAIDGNENEPRYWIKLAKAEGAMQNFAGAGVAYQRALDLQPDNIEALENLAALTVRSDSPGKAKEFYEPLLLLAPDNILGLLSKAILALHDRRYAEAGKIADTLMANASDLDEAYLLKARVLDGAGQRRAAIEVLEKRSLANTAARNKMLVDLLDLYRRSGDVQGVRSVSVRLAKLYPDDPRYVVESARAFYAQGRPGDARAALAGLSRRYANSTIVIGAIAAFWRDNTPPDVARAEIRRMAETASPAIKAVLANVLVDLGAAGGVPILLAPLIDAPVVNANVDGQVALARAEMALGRSAAAGKRVARVLAYDATNSAALIISARIALARRDYAVALTSAQLASSGDPENEAAQRLIAQIYAAQGNNLLAGPAFGDLRRNFPQSISALRAQIDWLTTQKRHADAVRYAADFARNHVHSRAAWQLYADTCRISGIAGCVDESRAGLKTNS